LDPRTAARTLLQTLAKFRQKDVLPMLLPFIQNVLSEYNIATPENRNYIQKDGVMIIIAWIFKVSAFSFRLNF